MSGLVESSADARSKTIGQNFRVRAWINMNGSGTVAIRGSGNVASITDLGTGQYRFDYSIDMPNTNYAYQITIAQGEDSLSGNAIRLSGKVNKATNKFEWNSRYVSSLTGSGGADDDVSQNVVIFG